MKKLFIFGMLALSLSLTACNTVAGFGKDMQKVGEKVQGAGSK
ncbi:entericidin A [Oxalobacteraceae bacterium GrIS 1.11]